MQQRIMRNTGLAMLAGMALLLAGCLLSPGKFIASLDLRRDGSFTYRYDGEVVMLGLTRLAQMGRDAATPFKPAPCHVEDDPGKPRPCTSREIDEQRRTWETARAAKAERQKREGEQAKALLGGIDPTDPKAAEELAERLRHQAGWRSVVYKGDGIYQVSFALSGRLTHDFAFPTIERFPMANAFITVTRRADGSARIDAPGFGGGQGGGGLMAMLGAAGAMAAMDHGDGKDSRPAATMPLPDGRFTLTTDAAILANNTEDGAKADPAGQRLEWAVSPRSAAAPMALVRLGQ